MFRQRFKILNEPKASVALLNFVPSMGRPTLNMRSDVARIIALIGRNNGKAGNTGTDYIGIF